MTTPTIEDTPRGPLRRWLRRWGWRGYALPALVVLTAVVAVQPLTRQRHPAAAAPTSRHHQPPTSPTPGSSSGELVETLRTVTDGSVCVTNRDAKLVVVSIHQQRTWMCQGHRQVYVTPVTTGATKTGHGTPTGRWNVQAKQRDRYLVGPGYKDWVKYWVPFNGDFGFHDSAWQRTGYGSPAYPTKGSHGCVHLPLPAMKWFYGWARVGTTTVAVLP